MRDEVVSGVGRKWKWSDSSDSDSVALMTPLTTPIFDFHLVISAFTTPTPSLVKNSLKKDVVVSSVRVVQVNNFFYLLKLSNVAEKKST